MTLYLKIIFAKFTFRKFYLIAFGGIRNFTRLFERSRVFVIFEQKYISHIAESAFVAEFLFGKTFGDVGLLLEIFQKMSN
jgi:hypothetical protein